MQKIPANELLAGLTLAEPVSIHAVVTDSREVKPGCVFVCFPGERVDGHDFAAGAYQNGAAYIIANHPVEGVPADRTVIVPDSAKAMIRMASNYRMLFSPKMIGVTGSVGKTTTKEFCYAVLSAFGKTLKTEGNQNNDIGVPNTLFRLDNDTEYAVVEMGMDHAGEIERLTRCARPSAGIITMIGVSHLENLGTRENILKAKMEICTGLPDGAPLVLNADNDLLPTADVPTRLKAVWFGIAAENADVRAMDVAVYYTHLDLFAKTAAEVLAANGIKVRIYKALMPVPALSFATRYYNCNAGIMVTASHNPAKYNGYKAYGPDGCQMTDEAADIVYAEIQKTDILTGAKLISFEDGLAKGLIEYVGDDCINALYAAIEARSIRPGICKTAGLKLVYSPLNGSGLVPVTHVLGDIGITDITIVPEQKNPDGNFPTCPYPNPEIFEALRLGLELAEKSGADLMLATDPDADRVGIAVKCKDGSYELLSGNEVGVLLLDYICAGRIEQGTMPKNPVMCKSIVSTPLADKVAEHYGVECRNVLTGFKWIGDQIAKLEAAGEVDRFIFGFEESYGYLAGPYVRDKDAIIGSMLICEMAAYYRAKGSSIKEELERIYAEYGRYLNKVDSFEFPGLSGMDKMAGIMQDLRDNPPKDFAGDKVVKVVDYKKPEETGLPAANVLIYTLESGATVVVRPSGTEPKIKTYFTTKGKDLAEAEAKKEKLAEACKPLLA